MSIVKGHRASGAGQQVQWRNAGSSRKLPSFADQGVQIKASKGQLLKGEALAKQVGMVAVKTKESISSPPCIR
jgi:hypothetical protein